MTVTLSDGRAIKKAKLVGADPKSDLAVVKIEADRVIAAKWGNSDELQKGDWILAFGSPFGYIGSMTHGIVSALNRDVGILRSTMGYENFIQVDAPINPGNSGGPLVNTRGEVVGINTAIASRSGGFQGIGFAIPSNQAKFVYTALKNNGKVVRGWLGVKISDVSQEPEKARTFGYQGAADVAGDQEEPVGDGVRHEVVGTGLRPQLLEHHQRQDVGGTHPEQSRDVIRRGEPDQPGQWNRALIWFGGGSVRPAQDQHGHHEDHRGGWQYRCCEDGPGGGEGQQRQECDLGD